jgi:hypothetical protein
VLDRICGAWLESNGYERQRGDVTVAGTSRAELTTLLRSELDLAAGHVASMLRAAAGICPRTARLVKQLVGIRTPDIGALIAWPEGNLSPSATDHHGFSTSRGLSTVEAV